MKPFFIFVLICLPFSSFAQENKAITKQLEDKYLLAVYHKTYGGWYSIHGYDGKEGTCNLHGKEIIPPIYDNVFFRGNSYEIKLNGKLGIFDQNGNVRNPIQYDEIECRDTYYKVKKEGTVGILDASGKIIIPCEKYDENGDETAHQMEEKHHGLFTYFLLKELQATGGDVDMGILTDYVTKQVKRQSVVTGNKKQTPTVIPSQTLLNQWQSMKLK